MTPEGIVPLQAAASTSVFEGQEPQAEAPASVLGSLGSRIKAFESVAATRAEPERPKPVATQSPALTPGDVIAGAKQRITELRAFIRAADRARKELEELERLVEAARPRKRSKTASQR